MAKTKLSTASKNWFNGKNTSVQQSTQSFNDNNKKMKVTLYVSKVAW